jgi:hypothetical protein
MTAEIIRFPRRRVASTAKEGQDRLCSALDCLNAAIAVQRQEMAAWRTALAELDNVVSELGGSLQSYRGSLDRLSVETGDMHSRAVELQRIADVTTSRAENYDGGSQAALTALRKPST